MRSNEVIRLPTAPKEYQFIEQQVMRRTAEQAFQDLRGDIISVRDQSDSASSLSLRRHQFLLMGAT